MKAETHRANGTDGANVKRGSLAHGFLFAGSVALAGFVLTLLAFAFFAGCTTVTPDAPVDKVASWDGNIQNSGYVGRTPDGSVIISANARERYNALIEQYGNRFLPPLAKDAGLDRAEIAGTNVYVIDAQHFIDFADMARWDRASRATTRSTITQPTAQ